MVILNAIIGFCMYWPSMIALICILGLFSKSTPSEKLIGILITIVMIQITALANFALWKFSKKGTTIEDRRIYWGKLAATIAALVLALGSRFLMAYINNG